MTTTDNERSFIIDSPALAEACILLEQAWILLDRAGYDTLASAIRDHIEREQVWTNLPPKVEYDRRVSNLKAENDLVPQAFSIRYLQTGSS